MQSSPFSPQPNPQPTLQQSLLPDHPLGVGDLLDRSFRLYRRNFRAFLYTAAILVLPLAVISAVFSQNAMQNQLAMMQAAFNGGAESAALLEQSLLSGQTAGMVALQVVLGLLSGIAWFLTFLALTHLAVRTLRGDAPTVSLAFEGAKRSFWPAFRLTLLLVLAFLGLTLVLMLVFVLIGLLGGGALGGLLGASDGSDAGAVGAILLVMCCIVPLLGAAVIAPIAYFSARWSVTLPAMLDEGLRARASLRRSWTLAQGSIWRILLYNLLVGILAFILFGVPFYLVQGLMFLLLGTGNLWLASVISTIFTVLLNVLWQPMNAIFPVLLYFDLRTRAEGGDISARLARLESTLPSPFGSAVDTAGTFGTAGPYPGLPPAPASAALAPSLPTGAATPDDLPSGADGASERDTDTRPSDADSL